MKYKKLGNSRTEVSAIGQGCMGLGGAFKKDVSRDDATVEALLLGIELSMTFIDTAEVYGAGHSEELVGVAGHGKREGLFIATKVSPENLAYDDLLRSAEASLKRLQTDYIDLYQVHWPNPCIPIKDTMRAMERLVDEGVVRNIGVSNFTLNDLKAAREALSGCDVSSIQLEYNLFDRTVEGEMTAYCEENGIMVIAYSPLDQGRITGTKSSSVLEGVAVKHAKTQAQVTLNWLVSHPCVVVIPKATNPVHIRENAGSTDFELTGAECEEISAVFASEELLVPTERIKVVLKGEGNRLAYQSIEDALSNKLGFVPSPEELSSEMKGGEFLKPVSVVKSKDGSGKYDYDLIGGRVRYWAWVIAHNGKRPIPVLLREQ